MVANDPMTIRDLVFLGASAKVVLAVLGRPWPAWLSVAQRPESQWPNGPMAGGTSHIFPMKNGAVSVTNNENMAFLPKSVTMRNGACHSQFVGQIVHEVLRTHRIARLQRMSRRAETVSIPWSEKLRASWAQSEMVPFQVFFRKGIRNDTCRK